MNNKNFFILFLCLLPFLSSLTAAASDHAAQSQKSTSWWPDGKTIVTQSCTGLIVGVVSILVGEWAKTPAKSPAQIAQEKAEAQVPAHLRDEQALVALWTREVAQEKQTYQTICAQCPSSPACQKRAAQLVELNARLVALQDPIITSLDEGITQLEKKRKQQLTVISSQSLNSNIPSSTTQGTPA